MKHKTRYSLILLLFASSAFGASFDCAKAVSGVEKTICANPALSELDEQLASQYQETLDNLPTDQAASIRSDQRHWLAQRNACGAQPAQNQARAQACLKDSMTRRIHTLKSVGKAGEKALDRAIAEIPSNPADAANRLKQYHGGLPSAWLVYLHQFEPTAGVSAAQAQMRYQTAVAALSGDISLLHDIEKDPQTSHGEAVLTLLRMQIEQADYDQTGNGRPYVHCFVFARQGDIAYKAMGSLYGSSRDGSAPICKPTGKLFAQPQWKRLQKAFDPLVRAADDSGGTFRFTTYADLATLQLRATLSPRDFLKPEQRHEAQDPANAIRAWPDEKEWPTADREKILKLMPSVQAETAQWLHEQRGLTQREADDAARTILFDWISDMLELGDPVNG